MRRGSWVFFARAFAGAHLGETMAGVQAARDRLVQRERTRRLARAPVRPRPTATGQCYVTRVSYRPLARSGHARNEHVLERRRHAPHVRRRRRRPAARPSCAGSPSAKLGVNPHVRPLAEHLHVHDARQLFQTWWRDRSAASTSQHCRGSDARNGPGESSASSRPSCSSATREQRSASSRYGVAMTMVMPCARTREQLPELPPRHRIHARRRLVEQDDLGFVHERARERQLLLHAAGEPVGQAGAERRELRHLEQPRAALDSFASLMCRPWISAKNAMFSSTVRSPYRLKRCER